jgi:DNA-nicking Smr family endonuclease
MERDPQEPFQLPIEDEVDLHTFRPAAFPDLIDDYLHECLQTDIFLLRISHGKGKRAQQRGVQ